MHWWRLGRLLLKYIFLVPGFYISVTGTVLLPPFRSFLAPGNLHEVEMGTPTLSVSQGKWGPHSQGGMDAFCGEPVGKQRELGG